MVAEKLGKGSHRFFLLLVGGDDFFMVLCDIRESSGCISTGLRQPRE
jgi:hypothetical protein